jgi:hypothetical protein
MQLFQVQCGEITLRIEGVEMTVQCSVEPDTLSWLADIAVIRWFVCGTWLSSL